MDSLACAVGKLALALRTMSNESRTPIPAAIPTAFLTQFAACLDVAAADLDLVLAVMAHGHEQTPP